MKGGISRSDFQITGIDGVVALYYVPKNALFYLMFNAREGLYRSLDIDLHHVLICIDY